MIAIVLLVLGLLAIFIEFYVPGAIMGAIGSFLVIASIIVFATTSESVWESVLFAAVAIVLVIALIKFALWRIPRAKEGTSIYLGKDQEGYRAGSFDASAIGKNGVVLSDLKPGGFIMVEGKKYAAVSQGGYLPAGSEITVIAGDGDTLVVKAKHKE